VVYQAFANGLLERRESASGWDEVFSAKPQ
jgi:hypothetical protein